MRECIIYNMYTKRAPSSRKKRITVKKVGSLYLGMHLLWLLHTINFFTHYERDSFTYQCLGETATLMNLKRARKRKRQTITVHSSKRVYQYYIQLLTFLFGALAATLLVSQNIQTPLLFFPRVCSYIIILTYNLLEYNIFPFADYYFSTTMPTRTVELRIFLKILLPLY